MKKKGHWAKKGHGWKKNGAYMGESQGPKRAGGWRPYRGRVGDPAYPSSAADPRRGLRNGSRGELG